MIDFVQNTAPEQAVRLDDMWLACQILKAAAHSCRTGDASIDCGKRKATLFIDLRAGVSDFDLRIYEGERHNDIKREGLPVKAAIKMEIRALGRSHIEDTDLKGLPNLLCRQTDAVGMVHCFEHGVGEFFKLCIKNFHRRTDFAQDGFAVMGDSQGHTEYCWRNGTL